MMLLKKRIFTILVLILPTYLLFSVSIILATSIRYGTEELLSIPYEHWELFALLHGFWIVAAYLNGLFDQKTLYKLQVITRITITMIICGFIAITFFYLQPNLSITPRRILILHLLISTLLITGWYTLIKHTLSKKRTLSILYIGQDKDIIKQFKKHIQKTARPIHFHILKQMPSAPSKKMDIICLEFVNKTIFDIVKNQPQPIYSPSQLTEELFRKTLITNTIEINLNQKSQRYKKFKRIADIFAGLILGIIFICSFPLIAFILKFIENGTIFFKQKRVTSKGKIFTIYKYRTMKEHSHSNTWTSKKDDRITRVGSILRKTHMDELPQALNLLRGDLSLVGPRPEQVHIVHQLELQIPNYQSRHTIQSGITGWAQLHVYASSVEESKEKLAYDLYYIKHQSFLFDLEILIKTLKNLLSFSGV